MMVTQHQWHSANIFMSSNISQGKKTSKSSMALEARVSMLKVKKDNSNDESLFADEKPKANNRNNSSLGRKGSDIKQSYADS